MNSVPDVLKHELFRVARALEEKQIPLIIGGGYGLLLWQRRVQEAERVTIRAVPSARSTEDLDVFFSVEVMSSSENTEAIRQTLDELGYSVVEGRENYQFARTVALRDQERKVKIDLLAPVPRGEEGSETIDVRERRLRPKGYSGLHAHPSPEAVTLSEHLVQVEIQPEDLQDGRGRETPATVCLPHLFTFVVLKLFAYRDRRNDSQMDYGRHHAYDLYRAVAMFSEEDWKEGRGLLKKYEEEPILQEAQQIVEEYFSDAATDGALAVLEYARRNKVRVTTGDVEGFSKDLSELLGVVS